MSEPRDPQRWKDAADARDVPPLWDAALRADQASGPDAAAMQRMLHRIAGELGRPELDPQPTAAAAGATGSSLGPLIKLALACVGVTVTIAAMVAYVGSSAREPAARPVHPPPNALTAPVTEPAPAIAETATEATEPAIEPAPVATRPKTVARAPAARTDAVAELALLERAQQSLAADPTAALALAQQHRRTYPRGVLAQEREMLAIDALLRLGRRADAERRGRVFERTFPASSHRARLADLLSSKP